MILTYQCQPWRTILLLPMVAPTCHHLWSKIALLKQLPINLPFPVDPTNHPANHPAPFPLPEINRSHMSIHMTDTQSHMTNGQSHMISDRTAFNLRKCHEWHKTMELQKWLIPASKERERRGREVHMRVEMSQVKLHIQEHFTQWVKAR